MIKNYYIFRHAKTYQTKFGLEYGDEVLSARILDEGKDVIRKMANFLKESPTDKNVSSELLRCRETVEIVTKFSGKMFDYDKRLNEYFNETFGQFLERVEHFLSDLKREDYQNVAICTHGAVIAALTHLITKNSFKKEEIDFYPDPGVLIIIENGQMKQVSFN